MKRAFVLKLFLFISIFAFAACGGCDDSDTPGNDKGDGSLGSSCAVPTDCDSGICAENRCVAGGKGSIGSSCLVGTDCDSGLCKDDICIAGGDDTCDGSGPCGDCDNSCNKDDIGGKDNPFKLGDDDPDSTDSGVVLDDDGAVTLDVRRIETNFIWIANTAEGTISKIDTRTYQEIARYLTGPDGVDNDPSRTSVNTFSDVYVGNRGITGSRSVTKISALGNECPDRNGDGMQRTSQGATDVLPWGTDDCIIWNTAPPGANFVRSIAAQDSAPNDDTLRPGVWVGDWAGKVWKLDSENGDILLTTDSPVEGNYGFALDGFGNLWISGWAHAAIGRINTLVCKDDASCMADAVCAGEDGDTCVRQRIELPHRPYGITVDFKQRVWTGGDSTSVYDPKKPAGSRFTHAAVGFTHGIAADAKGFIWVAGMTGGMFRLDAENPLQEYAHPAGGTRVGYVVPGTEQSSKGIAVDLDGKIWSINREHSSATVVTPGAGVEENVVETEIVKNLVEPYTYSDMTGSQLRFATDELGFYRRVFEGCQASNVPETLWSEARWDVETPGDTSVVFRARGSQTRAGLDTASWISVATVPSDISPKDISQAFVDSGLQGSKFVELEAQLKANRKDDNSIDVPKLKAMSITYRCPVVIQ